MEAMREEMDSLIRNKTWILVNKPKDQKVVDCKWVYRVKEGDPNNEGKRYMVRLVAEGFT